MKNLIRIFLLISFGINSYSQISNFKEKFILPNEVNETSGLLFYNDKIITHNDSGDTANLYEIDSLTGNIVRTIHINNATNIDWEDITQDETHIYIADFGNNNGNRTDLKIYKILKQQYVNTNSLSAEIISFSYEDQTDFNASNTHNFDAESIVVFNDNLLIFSKNRGDLKTNVYKIPKSTGNYSATKVSSFNAEGFITGTTYNVGDDSFMLSGYSSSGTTFLVYVSNDRDSGNDIFNNGAVKIDITADIGPSQIEGITFFDNERYYLSREEVNVNAASFPPKLYEFKSDFFSALSIDKNSTYNQVILYPNPTRSSVFLDLPEQERMFKLEVFNSLGKKILTKVETKNELDISSLPGGIYSLKIHLENKNSILKKLIKL
jgi:hypothetical protein